MDRPIVNAWTEFGDLEYICVGTALNACYPENDPFYEYNSTRDKHFQNFLTHPVGPRPKERIALAQKQLNNLRDIFEGESITVATLTELEKDIKEDLVRKRSFLDAPPANLKQDKRIKKRKIKTCQAPDARYDHLIMTPWFSSRYQFCAGCPRDVLTTLGNTILETPTASRHRYFESAYYRDLIYDLYNKDRRVKWKQGPKPTCADSMFDFNYPNDHTTPEQELKFITALNEKEVAFDAADITRVGKDIFYKRSASANNKGIEWLRREFPEHRFHMMHFRDDLSPHIDVDLVPLKPPTSGSDGIVLVNINHPPLDREMEIFIENDWKPLWAPKPVIDKVSPVAVCTENLNLNLLIINSKCVIIEECETPLYHFLEDLGIDVITCELRALNEFGGGPHCVTWDIRREDEYKDYFPNQNYTAEQELDLNNLDKCKVFSKKCNLDF